MHNLTQLMRVLTGQFGLVGAGVLAFVGTRQSAFKSLQQTVEGLNDLLKGRDTQLDDVCQRVGRLGEELTLLRKENSDLRSLNLQVQRENLELRGQVQVLHERVRTLEAAQHIA